MELQFNPSEWSVKTVRGALLDGENARAAGGEDARANRPPPNGAYSSRFMRDVFTRAEAMRPVITAWEQDEYAKLAGNLRDNPFLLDTETKKARHVPETARSDLRRLIAHETPRLLAVKARTEDTDIVYRHDLQRAGAKHPPRGWPDAVKIRLEMLAILWLEGIFSALILWYALGPMRAVITGIALSAASLAGGYFAALAALRPLDQKQSTRATRRLQWAMANAIGLVILLLLYVGACFRAAWIEGAEGTSADVAAKFNSPVHVLVNADVLLLMALGIAGFAIGALECWRLYHGYRRLLRESGLAQAQAGEERETAAEEVKSSAIRTARAADSDLDGIGSQSAEWARGVARHCDEANGVCLEAKRRDDLIRLCVPSIFAEYADGYQEVRHFDRADSIAPAIESFGFAVPELFARARQAAIAGVSEAADVVRQAHAQIASDIERAIIHIDELAGLRPLAAGHPFLQLGGNG